MLDDHQSQIDFRTLANSIRFEGRNFIDGEFVEARSGGLFESVNPATEEVLTTISRSAAEDVDAAVRSARRAYKSGVWSRLEPRARMEILYRFAGLLDEHAHQFAVLDTLDMGKPISETLNGDVPQAILTFQYFAEAIDKIEGSVTNTASTALHYILRQPLGVVGCIVPWNYPMMMASWKVAPALAAGNTVVLKPAEQSPLSAGLMAQLFIQAGGPPGAFNVVQGIGEEAGQALALHNGVDKISFTGSVEVGKLMMHYSGKSNLKRVSTECGGKSPQIILSDVEDFEESVRRAVYGIYGNQGEVCSAGSRILVEKNLYGAFAERFQEMAREMYTPGDPLDKATTMGPLVTDHHRGRVMEYIKEGVSSGATLQFGGSIPTNKPRGFFLQPTLFLDVRADMRIAKEEIFGPVAAMLSFDSFEEAIDIANDSIYGLAASIWTKDITKAHEAARDLEAGIIWINCYDHGDMTAPWGGFKQSGNGRDKCFEAILAHTQTKSVWVDLGA